MIFRFPTIRVDQSIEGAAGCTNTVANKVLFLANGTILGPNMAAELLTRPKVEGMKKFLEVTARSDCRSPNQTDLINGKA